MTSPEAKCVPTFLAEATGGNQGQRSVSANVEPFFRGLFSPMLKSSPIERWNFTYTWQYAVQYAKVLN